MLVYRMVKPPSHPPLPTPPHSPIADVQENEPMQTEPERLVEIQENELHGEKVNKSSHAQEQKCDDPSQRSSQLIKGWIMLTNKIKCYPADSGTNCSVKWIVINPMVSITEMHPLDNQDQIS